MRGVVALVLCTACGQQAGTASGSGSGSASGSGSGSASASASDSGSGSAAGSAATAWHPADDTFIPTLLDAARATAPVLDAALADPASMRLQIAVTEAQADARVPGGWRLRGHGYRLGAEYVYTASAMKLAVSIGVLAAMAEQRAAGVPLELTTPLRLCPLGDGPCDVTADASNLDGGTITIGHELRKMHLVSDNQAFGRLLDVVGAGALHARLAGWGLADVRLAFPMDVYVAAPPPTPRVELMLPAGPHLIPERASLVLPPLALPGVRVGVAHVLGGQRRPGPRDMSDRNYASVADLHRLLLGLVVPGAPGVPVLGLAADLRAFLLQAMTEEPTASRNPRYDDPSLDGARYRPSVAGVERVRPRSGLHIISKAGRAYGFYTENAWIEDPATGRAFALTATVYADDDGVIGDDRYRYDELARPILAALGEQLTRQLQGTL
jgi:hypothetical protein